MAGEVGIYIIDACCIVGLENAHTGQSQQDIYPAVEQRKIWDGLQALAEAGQLKIVIEVIREISARTQGGAERLKALPKTRVQRTSAIMSEYQNLVSEFTRWRSDGQSIFDSGDPWLISTARIKGYTVLTDETPFSTKTTKWRRGKPLIPDVCGRKQVVCFIGLREFAKQNGWLD